MKQHPRDKLGTRREPFRAVVLIVGGTAVALALLFVAWWIA